MENIKRSNKLLAGVVVLIAALALSFVAVAGSNTHFANATNPSEGGGQDTGKATATITEIQPAGTPVPKSGLVATPAPGTTVDDSTEELLMNVTYEDTGWTSLTATITYDGDAAQAEGKTVKFFVSEGVTVSPSTTTYHNGKATVTLTKSAVSNGQVVLSVVSQKLPDVKKGSQDGTNKGATSAKTGVFF